MQVLQRLAEQTGDPERVLFRQGAHGLQQMRQCAAAQILGHQVWTALRSGHGNEFQYVRMIQLQADLFLAMEARVKAGVALEFQMRHLQGDVGIVVEQVLRLENHGHATPADDLGNQESFVQNIARVQFPGPVRFNGRVIFGHTLTTSYTFKRAQLGRFHGLTMASNDKVG